MLSAVRQAGSAGRATHRPHLFAPFTVIAGNSTALQPLCHAPGSSWCGGPPDGNSSAGRGMDCLVCQSTNYAPMISEDMRA
jgi:hypothetical protein